MDETGLTRLNEQKNIIELLREPTVSVAAFLTGFLSSEKNDWKLSAGKLVQAIIKNKFFTQLGLEIKSYTERGQIKQDYLESDLNRATLLELLKCIDEDAPDHVKFQAMKQIFIRSVSINNEIGLEEIAYEFMKICRKLSSAELLILKTAYSIAVKPETIRDASHAGWISIISSNMPVGYKEIVPLYENNLQSLTLIGGRTHSDQSGIHNAETCRLTPLGLKLCGFICEQ